jgi:hypothetical protein
VLLERSRERDDLGAGARDRQRRIDRLLAGRLDVRASPLGRHILQERRGIELDELFGMQPKLLGPLVGGGSTFPPVGSQGHLLEQRRRSRHDRRRRRTAGRRRRAGSDLAQEVAEALARARLRSRQSPPCASR